MANYAMKTARLTLAQHGAYTLLLDEVYATERGLPAAFDELYRICRAMSKPEQEAVRSVAEMFFPVGADGLRHNERAKEELIEAAPALEAARLNGKKGGRPKKETSGYFENNPMGFQNETQTEPSAKPPYSLEEYQGAKAPLSPEHPATTPPDISPAVPHCPHTELLDLFAKHLPELPQPKAELWDGARADALKARWRWVLTAKKRSGDRYASTKAEGLAWFVRFFEYVHGSDFLTGRSGEWSCDLGWLVKAENFAKVIQGNYENKEKAA
jgi:uncharacterized protein YdaU (DUF1376 family)